MMECLRDSLRYGNASVHTDVDAWTHACHAAHTCRGDHTRVPGDRWMHAAYSHANRSTHTHAHAHKHTPREGVWKISVVIGRAVICPAGAEGVRGEPCLSLNPNILLNPNIYLAHSFVHKSEVCVCVCVHSVTRTLLLCWGLKVDLIHFMFSPL